MSARSDIEAGASSVASWYGDLGERQAGRGDHEVDDDGDVRRVRHVVHAQQIEAGEQAAEHRAGDVAAVEEAQPGDAFAATSRPSARSPGALRP